ncbi:anaphase-promoting complex subunit cut9 [Gaeumannomyces tritici R3-111a-1]|uniref:Anaphase-promoting complex subunit cut9 n=1 Tax=Gaeumannomyces tritici (strain R3-111a-1) TaxID=644352 RepID=J3PGC3_GAET3|nr:anaphase-promoting complex subunit cut9 [Gaeumannomyces tritici R3-111a-1]EJT69664.1 anaphase-promoting complex subunit cut9 [Gaeumannomyces tritici R3-111a-1]
MERFLRDWRQDALNKAQYESAIFVGDKLLALTNDDKDAFWLAQVHFASGNFTRAQSLLSKSDLVARNPSCRYLSAHCLIKQSQFEEALAVLGDRNPTHLIPTASNKRRAREVRTKTNGSSSGTNGVGGSKAQTVAERQQQLRDEEAAAADEEEALARRYEAGMCYLRGLCFAKQNAFDRAKECYKDAVRIDVQCFEAFQQLTKNHLMSPREEWEFLDELGFDAMRVEGPEGDVSDEAASFTKMLYSTRLSKYRNQAAFKTATEALSSHYGLGDNPDLLLAQADLLYTQCRYKDALAITGGVLEVDKYNFAVYPLHLACLHELRMTNVLFLVAHDLADHHPEEPCTWLAVGIYYFSIGRVAEARRYFSKASMMDAHFGPAWIGFAHTFAAEGEHDQAISAYSTAARLFMGTHLPQVFLGMQNHAMHNMTVAEEFLKTAYDLCRDDPLLLNEMGVVFYHQDRLKEAAQMFRRALDVAAEGDGDPQAWLSSRTNLAHAYRRLRLHGDALEQFDEVLRLGGKDPAIFCAKGLIHLDQGRPEEAVVVLHEALAVNPQDPVATELLGKALDETAGASLGPDDDLADVEAFEQDLARRERAMRLRRRGAADRAAAAGDGPVVGLRARDKGKGKERERLQPKRESLMDMSDIE